MKKRNRLLAIVLTAIMTLSMVPSAVFATEAAGSGETAEAAVEEVSSVGEEQDAEPAAEEVTSAEETAKETVQAAEEDDEAEPEKAEAEEAVTEEAADPAMDQENEAAEEEAAGPEETEETVEPAAAAEEEVAAEEAAETVEWPVTLESKGSDYTVTASFDESAGFPADAQMKVSEIRKNSGVYQDYYDQALEAVQNETDKDVTLSHARFFDITFYTEDGEVEPTGPVNISIKYRKAIDVESRDDVHVLHFDNNNNDAPQIMDIETAGRGDKVNEVSFETDAFSIYAVVGTETTEPIGESRATVKFLQADGTEIKTMYVKNSDDADALENIIYDPGAGTVKPGFAFYGWSVDDLQNSDGNYYENTEELVGSDYTVKTTPKTIAEVRTHIEGLEFKEGDILNVYAMTFTHYMVEFVDSTGTVSVGSGSALVKDLGDEAEYPVNMGYPTDDTHNFEGWQVTKGLDNITDPNNITAETVIKNETEIKITGNITLNAVAPEGHWLVFDENASGATYNAPRFFKNGVLTNSDGLLPMVRRGYKFAGWYTEATCENEYTFNEDLQEKRTIYAKWTAATTADYTILIWKQNLDADGYDFEDSISLNGTVGNTVNTVTQQGSGDNAYARINGRNYTYTGFHLDRFDQNVTITPEGNAVVNVYYNRTSYTLTFRRYANSGTVYKTITALYGQYIGDNFPISVNGDTTYRWEPHNSSTFGQVLVFIDVMPAENVTFSRNSSNAGTKYMEFYVEALPGQTADRTWEGKNFVKYGSTIPAKYNFFTEAEDFLTLIGYDKYGSDPAFSNGQANVSTGGTIYFYYTRQEFTLNFMDGAYYDGNGNRITTEASLGQLDTVSGIAYQADLTSYNEDGANYKTPTGKDGYIFEGWFIDDACTQAYTFTTMPEGGLTVYAKWRQIQYRVFLHPNAGDIDNEDPSLDWGSENQAMNFRVSYGDEVSTPEGRRTGYEFYGWYFDEGLSAIYPDSFKLHENDATYGQYFSDYDKTTDFTDPMDKWGNGATENKDTERFWITKKLDIYARWSQVTVGADGINVVYDAGDGYNGPKDNLTYKDNSTAAAGAASTPYGEKKVFKHWVVQTWNGSTYVDTDSSVTVLPGGSYTIHVEDAKVVDKDSGETVPLANVDDDHRYVYTIQLRAVYGDAENPTPTHITWYANNGTGNKETSTDLKINEAVDIKVPGGIFTYTNNEFLGWARLVETSDEQGNVTAIGGAAPANLALSLKESDLFLKWDAENERFLATAETGSGYDEGDVVKQIAADEKTDYHGMVAVWKRSKFHIYHSATGEVDDLEIPDGPVDLTTYVTTPGYLYGGYYHYDEVEGERTQGDVYTFNGKAFQPEAGVYYYLKEVPESHLRPKIYLISNNTHNGLIQGLYGIVSIDENAYSDVGFIIKGTKYTASLATAGIAITENGTTKDTLTGNSLFNMDCVIGMANFTDMIAGGATIDIKGYYVTFDGVMVTGNKDRRIRFPAGDSRYNNKPLFTSWGKGEDQTLTGLISSTSVTTYVGRSLNSVGRMNAVRMLTISAPSDKIEYTITKVYDSGTEEQAVEGGNYTGQITYEPKDGFMFAGWYQDAAFTVPADFSDITSDMTVYAKYVSNNDVTLAFSRKSKKSDTTTFNATISVKNKDQLKDVTVNVNDTNSAVLANQTVKKSGSGKNVKYTTQYKGQVSIKGLSMIDSFTASVTWTTPDGTSVTGTARKCSYLLGFVSVQ